MSGVDILQRAKEILQERGWIKGNIYEEGHCCLVGALAEAEGFAIEDDLEDEAYPWVDQNTPSDVKATLIECANERYDGISGDSINEVTQLYKLNDGFDKQTVLDYTELEARVYDTLDCAIEKLS